MVFLRGMLLQWPCPKTAKGTISLNNNMLKASPGITGETFPLNYRSLFLSEREYYSINKLDRK